MKRTSRNDATHPARVAPRLAGPALLGAGLLCLSLARPTAPHAAAALSPATPPAAHGSTAPGSLEAAFRAARYLPAPTGRPEAPYAAANPAHGLQTTFRRDRVQLNDTGSGVGWRLGLRLAGIGRGGKLRAAPVRSLQAKKDRVEYHRSTADGVVVTEWYVNAPEGVEQGFTLGAAPEGATSGLSGNALTVAVEVEGTLRPAVAPGGQAVELRDAAGSTVVRGAGLKAWDSTGRELPIAWKAGGERRERAALTLQVNDADAVYPVTIDPTFTQVQKLTEPPAFQNTSDGFGWAVAIEGDTAVVGAGSEAAAYVFTRSGGVWSLEQRLTAPAVDGDVPSFGVTVSLSGDTLVVGAPNYAPPNGSGPIYTGVAYVFTRSGGVWTQQAKLLPPELSSNIYFGWTVVVDGNTLAIDAPSASPDLGAGPVKGAGEVYVYTRSGTQWTLEQRITEPAAFAAEYDDFGYDLDLDGDTLVAGVVDSPDLGSGLIDEAGAAYVFTRTGTVWSLQQKLTEPAGDAGPHEYFGGGIALDGDTVVVGAQGEGLNFGYGYLGFAGAAYVFTRTGSTWTQRAKLTEPAGDAAADESFGQRLAIDGETVVVAVRFDAQGGAPQAGAAYVFTRSGSTWAYRSTLTQPAGDLAPYDSFGQAVSISGTTILVGAINDSPAGGPAYAGSAHLFLNSNVGPAVEGDKTLAAALDTVTGVGITAPVDPEGDTLTLDVTAVPDPAKGVVRKAGGGDVVAPGDALTAAELTGLEFHPVTGQTGLAGVFSYHVSDGNGGFADQTVTIVVSDVVLTAPATGITGQVLTVHWTAPAGQSATDWVGFFRADVPGPSGYLGWVWTGGRTSGTFSVVPRVPGTYVFRYYLNNGGTLAAASNLITISDPAASEYKVTFNPASTTPGSPVTLSWTAPEGRPSTDWIGIYTPGTPGPSGYLTWFYVGGTRSGSKTLPAPAAGTYVARYYLQDSGTLIATSNTLTVAP